MSARLLLVSSDEAVIRAVRAALSGAESLLTLDCLPKQSAAQDFAPNAVLLDSDVRAGVQTAFERIETARRRYPAIPVIVLGNEMSAQLVLAALRAGADEFLDREADAPHLALAIRACLARQADAPATSRARMAGVLSALASEQDQDFALNLAVRAATLAPQEMTLYIDLSVPATQAGIALGLKPEFGVSDAVREVARVDRALLESALARDSRSGLYILPLCTDYSGDVPLMESGGFGALLQILRGFCATIVLGFGPFSHQRALLEMAGPGAHFFLCCNQRFPSIRGASELLRFLSESGLALPQIVIHGLAPGRTPLPADIRSALKIGEAIELDASWEELAESVNDAKPLALTQARYNLALDACLARMGLAPEPEADFLTQLRSWLSPKFVLGAR
jgi:pilus assembly protein CpaE